MEGKHSRSIALLLAGLVLSGCATGMVATIRVPLRPAPNECQVNEIRPTAFSTLATSVCWDAQGRAIGLVGGPGKARISLPLDVISSLSLIAGPVGGALLLGSQINKLQLGDFKPDLSVSVVP